MPCINWPVIAFSHLDSDGLIQIEKWVMICSDVRVKNQENHIGSLQSLYREFPRTGRIGKMCTAFTSRPGGGDFNPWAKMCLVVVIT